MLITAILCDTSSPDRMIALAELVINASSEVKGQRSAFNNLLMTNIEYERISSIGDLDDVDKVRVELGYALAACMPLFPRESLENIAITFSEWVKEKRMKEVQSIIDVIHSQSTAGPDFAPKKDRSTMTAEKRSHYVQEMDQEGLLELLSRLTLAKYHQDALRKEALVQLSKKTGKW
ncbi:hypothetical protein PMIN06_005686 [Paraphaeosphaeria minitans]|uniref:Uncharacterized protein n=1 Tax=Paraphaeosphaeria minitans TaxID=565426 RepID=A0A9P6GTQ3_9PLEO|nr:hypothetical protein PMIN01_02995 [Paraphaeosphaeria minitans]